MKCYSCGSDLEKITTNIPFKISAESIIIVKRIPVLQCNNCGEYLIEDLVMKKIDVILENIDKTAELEILSYAV